MDSPAAVALIVLAAALLVPAIYTIAIYNRFVRTRQHIKDSWANIDVELQRRYDLIPNLVQTVKGYAAHEAGTLETLMALRNKAMANHGTAASQAVDESAMLIGLGRVFAIAEAYPQLKADAHFLALQKELANTEDRIAAARRFFNGNVRDMNQLCATFPTAVFARVFGFGPETFFELGSEAERAVPRVSL